MPFDMKKACVVDNYREKLALCRVICVFLKIVLFFTSIYCISCMFTDPWKIKVDRSAFDLQKPKNWKGGTNFCVRNGDG